MYTTIINTDALVSHLNDTNYIVFDCRHDLTDHSAGRQMYEHSHIPAALFFDMEHDAAGIHTGTNGRHPLPTREAFVARMAQLGVGADTQVIAYDHVGGQFAARLWWMMRWIGHSAVAVLDGGWQAWQSTNPVETGTTSARGAGQLKLGASLTREVDVHQVLNAVHLAQGGQATHTILDARAADRYAGLTEPMDPVAGHIPSALNRFYKDNLQADLRFKPLEQLRGEFDQLLQHTAPNQWIIHCGSGVTACHHLLVMHALGYDGAALYPGSWSEWVADSSRPVATGIEPPGIAPN